MPRSRVQVARIKAQNLSAKAQTREASNGRRARSVALPNLWYFLPKHHKHVETYGQEA